MEVLYFAFGAVSPIVILVLIGFFAKRMGFFSDRTLKEINKFNFRFGFICLIFRNLYEMKTLEALPLGMMVTLLVSLVILTLVGYLCARVFTDDTRRRAIIMQSAFRSNYAIIGLVLAESVAGLPGRELATLFQLPTVLYYNVVSVTTFSVYGQSGKKVNWGKVVKGILTNPFVDGLILGSLAFLIRNVLPLGADGEKIFLLSRDLPWLYKVVTYLAQMATPLALVVLGAQLRFDEVREFRKELATGVLLRLVVAPVIGFSIVFLAAGAGLIAIDPAVMAVFIAVFGSPLAVATVVMASEMGADDRLAGQVVVWTSVLGMVSLFLIISVLRAAGML